MNENSLNNVKIMVVDDEVDLESLVRQKFRRQIREGMYDFIFAYNGLEALAKLIENPNIGVILSDINMPEMDGLTLLSKLKELKNPGLKTVIVSAYGDMENIRTAMNRGAFDFVTKPINFDDLEITINKTLEEITQIRKSAEEHDQLISIQQDLTTAREIQQAILPKNFPPFPSRIEFDLYASMVAAKEVGGDFYDFFMIDKDRLGFVIGDVSGKGVPAAIFMAVSRTLIRATGLKGIPTDECMNYVNNLLCNESVSCMFVTVFYGILNMTNGELEYVNAGHNPPFVLSSGNIKFLEMTGGTILGCIEGLKYQSKKCTFQPGDRLFLYTDGVTEAFNKEGKAYGEYRLKDILRNNLDKSTEEMVKLVSQDVNEFSTGVPQSDDITMLAIHYHGID
ncbi:MAG: SpoIIE family protein phosphatase [Bacteroidales bacterium]|nr:SpoIIE family protein phosphatase [Bacteroidales bacterium]